MKSETQKTVTPIAHISDIHIGSDSINYDEHCLVMNRLVADLAEIKAVRHYPDFPICIAGDIFQHKGKYTGADVSLFKYFIAKLREVCSFIVIIPGNHDDNIVNPSVIDLLQPLCNESESVYYLRDTVVKTIGGITFLHISIFDNTSDYHALVKANEGAVVLYHGRINGSRRGVVTESKSRVTDKVLDAARLFLAGDYHEYQFLRPHAAYSGSLTQQNIKERPVKGYILWDLVARTGEFRRIHNDRASLTLDFTTGADLQTLIKQSGAPPGAIFDKIGVVTNSTGAELENELANIYSLCRNINEIKIVGRAHFTNDAAHHTAVLSEILVKNGATGDDLALILDQHESAAATPMSNKWTLNYMKWDNILAWGADNYIDFRQYEGSVSGIIAPNKYGKTAIMDVIMFGLFNQIMRGTKTQFIHTGAKRASVEIDFQIGEYSYNISRIDTCTGHVTVRLMRKRQTGQEENLSGKSVDATYRTVVGLIGSPELALSTGMFYRRDKDFIKMTKTERLHTISTLLGMDYCEKLVRAAKADQKKYKDDHRALVRPRSGAAELDEAAAACDELRAKLEKLESRLQEVSAALTGAGGGRGQGHGRGHNYDRGHNYEGDDLTGLVASITKLEKEVALAAEIVRASGAQIPGGYSPWVGVEPPPVICDRRVIEPLAAKATAGLAERLRQEVEELEKTLPLDSRGASMMAEYKRQADNALKNVELARTQLITATAATAEAAKVVTKTAADMAVTFGVYPDIVKLVSEPAFEDGVAAEKLINDAKNMAGRLAAEISQLRGQIVESDETALRSLIQQRNRTAEGTGLDFNPDCASCSLNKNFLAGSLADLDTKIAAMTAATKKAAKNNISVEAAMSEKTAMKTALLDFVAKSRDLLDSRTSRESRRADMISADKALARANDILFTAEATEAAREDYVRIKAELAEALAADEAKRLLAAADIYTRYRLTMAVENNKKIEDSGRAALEELWAKLKSVNNDQGPAAQELRAEEKRLNAEIGATRDSLGFARARLEVATKEAAIAAEYNKRAPALEAAIRRQEIYIKSLSKGAGGLQMEIVKRNMDSLIAAANSYLQLMDTTSLSYLVAEDSIDIFYTENGVSRCLEMCSGFMAFAISISFRLAIMSSTLTSPKFIFADEEFGALDSSNLPKVLDTLTIVNSVVKNMFIVSHRPELQSVLERPVVIERRVYPDGSYYSRIYGQNGQSGQPLKGQGDYNSLGDIGGAGGLGSPSGLGSIGSPGGLSGLNSQPAEPSFYDLITCECGARIKKKSYSGHVKTAKHAAAMAKLTKSP